MSLSESNFCFLIIPNYRTYYGYTGEMGGWKEYDAPRNILYIAIGATTGAVLSKEFDMNEMWGYFPRGGNDMILKAIYSGLPDTWHSVKRVN